MNVASVVIESSQKVLSSYGGLVVGKKIYDELCIVDHLKLQEVSAYELNAAWPSCS